MILFKKILYVTVISLFVIFGCEKQVSVSPPDEPPPDGKLLISSYPDSFRIFIDGKNRLRLTPDSISWLETNNYSITLKKEYYFDTSFIADVVEGNRTNIFVDIAANPRMRGEIYIDSKPDGGEIFINDSSTGKFTPSFLRSLLPGIYKITVSKENHKSKIFYPIVRSSNTTKEFGTLVDTTVWDTYNTDDSSIPNDNLLSVHIDPNNTIWLGTRNGLIKYKNNEAFVFTVSNSILPNNIITSIVPDLDGSKWVTTAGGIARVSESVFGAWASKYTGFPTDSINYSYVQEANFTRYLFATTKGLGKYAYDSQIHAYVWGFEIIPNVTNLTSLTYFNSDLIIGTKNEGLVILADLTYKYFTRKNSDIPGNAISCMYNSIEGVWVGHLPGSGNSGGLSLYNNRTFKGGYNLKSPAPIINAIFVDSDNRKWIGTDVGIFTFNDFSDNILLDEEVTGLPIKNVTGITQDSKGHIWFTTNGNGLFELKNLSFYTNN